MELYIVIFLKFLFLKFLKIAIWIGFIIFHTTLLSLSIRMKYNSFLFDFSNRPPLSFVEVLSNWNKRPHSENTDSLSYLYSFNAFILYGQPPTCQTQQYFQSKPTSAYSVGRHFIKSFSQEWSMLVECHKNNFQRHIQFI